MFLKTKNENNLKRHQNLYNKEKPKSSKLAESLLYPTNPVLFSKDTSKTPLATH